MVEHGSIAEPTCIRKWTETFVEFPLTINTWGKIFSLSFKTTIETKLQAFQFKILHRISVNKYWLHNMGIATDSICDVCKTQTETICHKFWNCPSSNQFWNQLSAFWDTYMHETIVIQQKDVIFGLYENPGKIALNYCILYGKYYIYSQRFSSANINFVHFLHLLNRKISVFKHLSVINYKLQQFDSRWKALQDAVYNRLSQLH